MFRLSAEACPNGRLEERTPLIAGAGSPQASAPPSLLSRPLLGDEDAGEELAGRTAGQAVAELEGARHLVAADPLADLNKTWAANEQAGVNFLKQAYNSFRRS